MADKPILLLSTPEAAAHAVNLFGDMQVLAANGRLPEGVEWNDVLAVSTSTLWLAITCQQLAEKNCARIRQWPVDLSQCSTFADVKPLTGSIKPYTSSAPSPMPADVLPDPTPATSGAEPAQEAAESTQDSAILDYHAQVPPEGAEAANRSLRNASALKRAAHENTGSILTGEWPDPADFWGATELPEFLPQYLPPAIEPYVTDQASRAGIDPAQVGLNCYVVCAALLRSGIELQMQEGSEDGRTWKEKPVLWGASVGDPSTGKGPAMDIALHKAQQIEHRIRLRDAEAWERYEDEAKIHERRMQEYIAKAAKNPQELKPDAPPKPPKERFFIDDATKEVVAKLLTENPRGKVTVLKDELASWFGSFGAYGATGAEKDRGDWLSFYESKKKFIDRAMEGRSYHVQSWGGCILGGIQPEILGRVSAKLGADGMMQRFMLIISKPKRQVPKRAVDPNAVKDWNRVCENLAAMQPGQHPVALSNEAAAYMDEQVQWLAQTMQAGFAPSIVYALGKWEGLFGRLMITSHCIECAAQGLGHPSPLVSLRTAEQAWGWLRWILWPHAVHFYQGATDQGDEFKSGKAFAEFVLARDIRKVKPHTLTAGWSHYRFNFKTIQQRREFWVRIEHAGWARACSVIDKNTALASEYEINPNAFDGRFSEQIEAAQASVTRYRQAMHPAMLAAQGREPGEEG